MKQGKKLLAVFLALALSLSVISAIPAQAAEVCFTAIDDSVLKLTNENMPIWSGGVLYAPYTTFNETDNGMSNWNIQVSYSKNNNKVTVFDTRRFLEFDLKTGTSWDDLSGVAYSGGAIVRGGRPYLPVGIVCDHFDMSYSYREIDQGALLRIKTEHVVITDRDFPDAAENVLNLRLREYNQSQPGWTPPAAPDNPQQPDQNPPPEHEHSVDTYIAFRCEDAERLEEILVIMEAMGKKGMYFLTDSAIRQRSDLVLRILGSGNSVGLLAPGEDMEQTRVLLSAGSEELAEQVFARTTVALVDKELREKVEQEGWVCWNSTLELTPTSTSGANYFSRRTITQLGNRTRDTYLTLDVSVDTVRILPTLLLRLDEEGFELGLPLETRL